MMTIATSWTGYEPTATELAAMQYCRVMGNDLYHAERAQAIDALRFFLPDVADANLAAAAHDIAERSQLKAAHSRCNRKRELAAVFASAIENAKQQIANGADSRQTAIENAMQVAFPELSSQDCTLLAELVLA